MEAVAATAAKKDRALMAKAAWNDP